MSESKLSASEVEKMRELLKEHDLESKPAKSFDLNNPPKQHYRHQKFPMVIYNHNASYPAHEEERSAVQGAAVVIESQHVPAKIVTRIVNSEEELQHFIEEGWREDAPEFRSDEVEPLTAALQAEADREQKRIDATKHRRKSNAA